MEQITPTCDSCGALCVDGFIRAQHGQRDRETGYQDESIICHDCDEADEDGRYEAADMAYDLSYEGE